MQPEPARSVELIDLAPDGGALREEVLAGLRAPHKTLPCRLFYDQLGSTLFDRICRLPEYYLTRAEISVLRRHGADLARFLGPRCLLVEYGSGSSVKTPLLLDRLEDPLGYVPIDISREHLLSAARAISDRYPALAVMPVCADYNALDRLPPLPVPAGPRGVFFPGSTIGNLVRPRAVEFLRRAARVCGPGGGLVVGVDRKKDPRVLHAAYNDAEGVTAAFNLNLLAHVSRLLDVEVDLEAFEHKAYWNSAAGRVEMHLVSLRRQELKIEGETIPLRMGETIHTENSYKYSIEEFQALAREAGLEPEAWWTDEEDLFSVHGLRVGS